MVEIQLHKMNGIGNDFLIYDARKHDNRVIEVAWIVELSDRGNGITGGCDQFIVLGVSDSASDVDMRIFNCDGSEVGACGNATRCVVWLETENSGKKAIKVKTPVGVLEGYKIAENSVTVNMGEPDLSWRNIPLSQELSTLSLPIKVNKFIANPVAVNVGNPHMVFFISKMDIDEVDVANIGAKLECHEFYPEKANVSFANVVDENNIKLRVFERGVGETQACGTGACATLVAAVRRGLTAEEANIQLRGGNLNIAWRDRKDILMSGDVEYERLIGIN